MAGRVDWAALGTTVTVLVDAPGVLARARTAVAHEVAAIDAACSRFRDDSELSRVNAAGGRPVRVSPLLLDAVGAALRAAAVTAGAVDPTVGEALVLAGYDRDFSLMRPGPVRLRAAHVAGWRCVALDTNAGTIAVPRGVRLDLGATAKALAADRAAAAATLAADGAGVLVALGGDIAVAGPAPGDGWLVGVAEDHRAPGEQAIALSSGGLATSSTTVRRWGAGAHHLIDPATGLPAGGPWRSATVAAASCLDANIASTAAIVLGERAAAWLRDLGVPSRLVDEDGTVTRIAGWPAEAEVA